MSHTGHGTTSTNRLAFQATVHCLTGCGIGEVLGLGAGPALGLSNAVTLVAISLAFAFVAAFPVNRWLVARGLGHAVMHGAHP
jgi:hypothetical protein